MIRFLPLSSTIGAAEIHLPYADWNAPIHVAAPEAHRWRQGMYEIWHLRGGVELEQGEVSTRSDEAVLWVDRADSGSDEPSKVIAYLEGDVVVDHRRPGKIHPTTGRSAETITGDRWNGRFHTKTLIEIDAASTLTKPTTLPRILDRGQRAVGFTDSDVRAIQHLEILPPASSQATTREGVPSGASAKDASSGGDRRVETPLVARQLPPPGLPAVPPPGLPAVPPPGLPAVPPPGQPAETLPPALGQPPIVGSGTLPPPPSAGGFPFGGPPPGPVPGGILPGAPARATARDLIVQSRGGSNLQIRGIPGGNETTVVMSGGVNIIVAGIENLPGLLGDQIDLEADRVVLWTANLGAFGAGQTRVSGDTPIEFYLEGNIVFRDGDRVVYADRMYYNVNRRYGVILNAELLTPVPEYQGLLRLKADVLQQLDPARFQAFGAAVTTSRLGVPRYWFQSDNVQFQDLQRPLVDPTTGQALLDPLTQSPVVDHQMLATARSNHIYLAGVPVAFWPYIATDLTEPTYYLNKFRLRNDNVFGTQVLLGWDLYQILGVETPPDGTDWNLSTDYLSDRGFGLGTNFTYDRMGDYFGPGRYRGFIDAWGIDDGGLDNLGADRRAVPLEADLRGRILAQHRHNFANGYQLSAELGAISDRNFLEQYYEREWDQEKDQITGLEFKRYDRNSSWSISSDVRLNDFFTQTQWLPRFDHTVIGQSILFDRATWHGHSQIGYAQMKLASTPTNPVDFAKFTPLAWEADREGLEATTRHEIDLPFDLGPVKVTPYALGEIAYWGNDLNNNEMTRAYGQAGVRTSLPFWRVDPTVQSSLFNLNGLAHKVNLTSDFFYADANQDMGLLPLYDPLDDDATEHFRRRSIFNTFNGVKGDVLPIKFDERYYALRTGMQSWVTAPSPEIAEDLSLARLGLHQRWQTKRGAPGQERIIDWIVLNVDGSFFPNPDRDNFGEEAGLLEYDFRWHVGDRLTVLSDGYMDVFSEGLRTASLGAAISRPERGSFYFGFRSIEGPITSSILSAAVNYRMSDKWIFTGGASVDLGPTGNIGQTFGLTRIGESALIKIGMNVDESRNNVGVNFSIEPRFLPSNRLGNVGGVTIPPAGAFGLE